MLPMPISASVGGGGPSGANGISGVSNPLDLAFNFDNSGWVVNKNSPGSTITATGNKDANQSTQTPTAAGGGLSGLLGTGGNMMPLLLMAGIALLVLRHHG